MLSMPMYMHVIFSYLAAVGFAVFLNTPKKTMYVSGLIGMLSWVIYVSLSRMKVDVVTSNLIAASVAGLLGEILSRKMKKPTILFVVPGIITLIPGLGLYNTMYSLIEGEYSLALTIGSEVILASGAIALGVILVSTMFRSYYASIRKAKESVKYKIKGKVFPKR